MTSKARASPLFLLEIKEYLPLHLNIKSTTLHLLGWVYIKLDWCFRGGMTHNMHALLISAQLNEQRYTNISRTIISLEPASQSR